MEVPQRSRSAAAADCSGLFVREIHSPVAMAFKLRQAQNPLLLGPDWCFQDWSETTGRSFEPILQPRHATSLSDLCTGRAETLVNRKVHHYM